jgi:hypothetical protein
MGYDSIAAVENPPLACCGAAAIVKAGDQPDFAGLVYGGR